MDTLPVSPVGVLVDSRGQIVSVVVLPDVQAEYLMPVAPRLSLDAENSAPASLSLRVRRFRLSPTRRSKQHQWLFVYNEGRSCTPEYGYVYIEEPEKGGR